MSENQERLYLVTDSGSYVELGDDTPHSIGKEKINIFANQTLTAISTDQFCSDMQNLPWNRPSGVWLVTDHGTFTCIQPALSEMKKYFASDNQGPKWITEMHKVIMAIGGFTPEQYNQFLVET